MALPDVHDTWNDRQQGCQPIVQSSLISGLRTRFAGVAAFGSMLRKSGEFVSRGWGVRAPLARRPDTFSLSRRPSAAPCGVPVPGAAV